MLKMKQIHTIKRHRSKNLCGTITVQEPLKLKATLLYYFKQAIAKLELILNQVYFA